MNRNTSDTSKGATGKDDGMLEKLAQTIDPPSREISDEELADPGANIPRVPMDKVKEEGKPGNRR